MKLLAKYLFLLFVGGMAYCLVEIAYRGRTHWSMFLVGGIAFIICGLMNEVMEWDTPLWKQMLACAAIITVIEFASGIVLNVWLNLGVWDYSNVPGNICGQICPIFSVFWFLLSAIAIVLDDVLRWKIFGEEKPRYRLL